MNKEAIIVKVIQSIFLLVILLSGNAAFAAAPLFAPSAESKYARGLKPPKGKAIIYIYQRKQDGVSASPTIWLNNYQIGRLVPGAFTVWQLAPGKLEVRLGGADPATLSLRSEAGKVYLFRISVSQTDAGVKAQIESLPESYRADMADTQLIKNPRQIPAAVAVAPVPAKPVASPTVVTPSATQESKPLTPRTREPRQTLEPGGYSVLLKTGSVTLSQGSQTLLGLDSSFDTNASGTYAVELDYQTESGLTVGGELMGYKTTFTWSGSSNDINVLLLLGNAKKYFNTDSSLQPFIGAGIGAVTTDVSGAVGGNTAGFAYQLMGGLEYRGQNFGVIGELKYIGAKTKDSTDQEIDVSATAILAGIVYHF